MRHDLFIEHLDGRLDLGEGTSLVLGCLAMIDATFRWDCG